MRLAIAALLIALRPLCGEVKASPPEPRITSIHPLAVRSGATSNIVIRGEALAGARAVIFDSGPVTARVLGSESGMVSAEVAVPADFTGVQRLRILAPRGVTNELALHAEASDIVAENDGSVEVARFPAAVTGALSGRGEVDTIWIRVKKGELLTFTAAAGSAAFDPSIAIMERSGSWFDETRLKRIAFNDEPLYFPGLSAEPRLVHRFERAGKYAVQISAFSGQGGPDFSYVLRITPGAGPNPSLRPVKIADHDERQFTRVLAPNWMAKLAVRGAGIETDAPSACAGQPVDQAQAPVIGIPGVVEGRISKPAEVHRVRVSVDKPQDLAIEVETPEATMPRFNPVVRLLAPDGSEIVTNVYTKRNNNGLYMMKMIQAKSTFSLPAAGEYTLEIRDITTDVAGGDFAYRVLLRGQIPHVGKVAVVEDRINLAPGESKPITVNLDREESFTGLIVMAAEGLPAGVVATAGMADPVERPPLPNGGRLERYVARPQTATLILTADENATPAELPSSVRVVVRTVVNGKPGMPIPVKNIPVMVISRTPS